MRFSLAAVCLANAVSVAFAAPQVTTRPTATVASGVLVGTYASVPSATAGVNKFLGVPFAASPPLRFAPPQAAAKWSGSRDASKLAPACVQQFNDPASSRNVTMFVFNNPPPPESEDCLYLNIYTPSTPAPKGGRAVLFWIYGGNLQFGDAGLGYYDGSLFAATQDVIVVTTNYRTNVFGFSNSPEIASTSQNAGFLDQRFALQWVQSNIAAFGGSPSKVTIFGESAGGYSVKNLFALPPKPVPFRGVIMESEAASLNGGVQDWEELVANVSCATAASALACVRSKPASLIKAAIEGNQLAFPPVADGVTHVTDVTSAIEQKTAAQVPFIIGTNANEGNVFAAILGLDSPTASLADFLNSTFPGQPALQAAIAAAYPATESPYYVASDVLTDLVFQCPAKKLSNLAVANGYSVWRYYFDAPFANNMPLPDLGAYHSSEILEVFGTYNRTMPTKQEIALSKYMQHSWANFAKNPKNGPGWVKLGSAAADVTNLGGNGNSGGVAITQDSIDGKCPLYEAVIDAEGI